MAIAGKLQSGHATDKDDSQGRTLEATKNNRVIRARPCSVIVDLDLCIGTSLDSTTDSWKRTCSKVPKVA